MTGKWFHGGYLADKIVPGQKLALYDKVEYDSYTGDLTMLHPEFEMLSGEDDEGEAALHVGRVVPIYEAVAKINTRVLRTLLDRGNPFRSIFCGPSTRQFRQLSPRSGCTAAT